MKTRMKQKRRKTISKNVGTKSIKEFEEDNKPQK